MFRPQNSLFMLPRQVTVLVLTLVVSMVLGTKLVTGGPDVFSGQPVLDDYLAWAQQHSPRLAEQAARSEALRANSRRVGALPRLKLAWGEMLVPVETRVGPQQRVFSVSQSFPWFGTLSAKENSLAAEADAALESLRGLSWQVERDVRAAWYDLIFIQAQSEIVAVDLALAQQTEVHARARYETGEGPYAAVLHAQMDIGRLDSRLTGLSDRRVPATTRLNIAAGLVVVASSPANLVLPEDLLAVELPSDDTLEAMLIRRNPTLAALRFQEEGRRQSVKAAGRRSYPDLTVGLDYIMTGEAAMADVKDSGQDPVIARLAVSIPLWGGSAAAEQKASAGLLRASSAGLAETRLRLRGELQNILFAWREAGRNRELYGNILLPRSGQNRDVVTASYESGQADFDKLQTARQAHLGLELALLRANIDRLQALNKLSALLGVSLAELASGELPVTNVEPESE